MRILSALMMTVLLLSAGAYELYAQDVPKEEPKAAGEKKADKEAAPPSAMMLEAMKYFPMDKGNWWEYKLKFETDNSEIPLPDELQEQVQRIEVEEVSEKGCRLNPGKDGGFSPFAPVNVVVRDGFIVQGGGVGGGEARILKLPPKKGDKWTSTIQNPADPQANLVVKHSVASIDTLQTLAGKFNDVVCVVSFYNIPEMGPGSGGMGFSMTAWYAPGVGLVQQEMTWPMGVFTLLLKKYHVKGAGDRVIAAAAAASELVVIAGPRKLEPPENLSKEEAARWLEEQKATQELERLIREAAKRLPEEAGKEPDKICSRLVVKKVLKGKLGESEIVVSAAHEIAEGVWVLFLGKLGKEGYPLAGPILPAQQEILGRLGPILNPPKPRSLAETLAGSDFVIVGRAVVKEERGSFSYWVFEVEKALKGDGSRSHLDVLLPEGMVFIEGARYLLALKVVERQGRKLYEIEGEKAEEYSGEKLEAYRQALQK